MDGKGARLEALGWGKPSEEITAEIQELHGSAGSRNGNQKTESKERGGVAGLSSLPALGHRATAKFLPWALRQTAVWLLGKSRSGAQSPFGCLTGAGLGHTGGTEAVKRSRLG